jgi:hypothetical protein
LLLIACKIRADQPEDNEEGNEDTGMLNLLQEDIEALEAMENMLRVQMEGTLRKLEDEGICIGMIMKL